MIKMYKCVSLIKVLFSYKRCRGELLIIFFYIISILFMYESKRDHIIRVCVDKIAVLNNL